MQIMTSAQHKADSKSQTVPLRDGSCVLKTI